MTRWPAHLLILVLSTSCTQIRLKYMADVTLSHPETGESAGPYLYVYEDSVDTGWFPLWCGLTGLLYGGYCWTYVLYPPFWMDTDELRKNARAALKKNTEPLRVERIETIRAGKRAKIDNPPEHRFYGTIYNHASTRASEPLFKKGIMNEIWNHPDRKEEEAFDPSKPIADWDDGGSFSGALERDTTYSYRALHAQYSEGQAFLTARVNIKGLVYDIASGTVPVKSYRVAYRSLPLSGWYWSWSPHVNFTKINISDFASRDIPKVEIAGTQEIPAVISDPETQQVISSEQFLNSYGIEIQNIGLKIGAGYSKSYKNKNQKTFWSWELAGWLHGVDYYSNRVIYETRTVKRSSFQTISGISGQADAYFHKGRFIFGAHYAGSFFPNLAMPDDIEFRGPPLYNSDKQVFERDRVKVDSLILQTRIFGLSISYIFKEYS